MTTNYYKTYLLALLASLALLLPMESRAQQMQAALSHYTTDDGLPSTAISSLVSDDYGYLWISTWNGLARFDGFDFYTYKTGILSGVRGMHNRVASATIDQGQNIWMKMYDGRMFVIDRKTDRYIDPLEGVSGHDKFSVDYFFNPYVTDNGDIMVSYGSDGLYRLRLDRNGLKQDHIMTYGLNVLCLVGGYHDDVWAGTEQGVRRINMSNLSLEKNGYFMDEQITQLATNGYNIFVGTKSGKILQFSYGQEPTLVKDMGREITGLFIDSRGLIWFSDLGNGAYYFDPATSNVKYFNHRVTMPEFTSRGAEFCEALGAVWVRLNHGGFGYYNRETDELEYFHNDPVNPWNLSNTVNACLEMNDGVIWESTIRRGLEKLEVQKHTIERRMTVPGSDSPMDNEIRAMCYDRKLRHTLICNKSGCIFVYDKTGKCVNTITHDQNGKPISRPYGMSVDSRGNYWVCDKDNGLYKITPSGKGGYTVVNICHDDNDKWSLSANSAYQAVEDHEGNIWVATYGGGVNIVRKNKAGKYIAIHAGNVLRKYPKGSYHKVRTIAVAKDGKVWAGTTDGILIMSLHNNNVTIEKLKEPEVLEKGLMSNDIVNLACDKAGTMWVGTNSGGLSHATKQDEQGAWMFKNYGVEDGLPSEEIRSITFDERGNVWFTTDHILCSFDVRKKIFTTFSQLDGVDDTMCSEGSAILGDDGKIIFGTLNGFYVIDRKKLTNSTGSLLKLHITDFFLNGNLQSPRLGSEYDYYVPESKKVVISSEATSFAFRFAALNYQLQHRVHYQYKLDGYDKEWRNADKSRMATYENVGGGKYKFMVKAFLLESPDAYDLRSIEVEVESGMLLSPVALSIYAILLLVALGGGIWWYRKQRNAANDDPNNPAEPTGDEPATEEELGEEHTDEYEILED